jgi:hypothetical protein
MGDVNVARNILARGLRFGSVALPGVKKENCPNIYLIEYS